MVIKWKIQYPAPKGEDERFAYVYLPEVAWDPERRFPVLYMFDGHNVFFDEDATYGKSWGLGEYLDEHGVPLIVAAVECNHDPNNGRLSEYAPYSFSARGFGTIEGRGALTMDWLIRSFKPEIDRNYPTLPDRAHTFIAGSSMGGLMSLYALCRFNEVFSRAAALCALFLSRLWFIDIAFSGETASLGDPAALARTLFDMGVRPGIPRSLDAGLLSQALQAGAGSFSYVGAHKQGVRLLVEAVPEVPAPPVYDVEAARDLICAVDGIVVWAVARSGELCVKPGAAVIDVAMNRNPVTGKFTGDVCFDEVKEIASHITPVPGGVGPMTRAMLLRNVLTLARLHMGLSC